MRGRLLVLTVVLLAAAGCTTQRDSSGREIPGMNDSHRVEQINASGQRNWN